jgi:hypothetical protein
LGVDINAIIETDTVSKRINIKRKYNKPVRAKYATTYKYMFVISAHLWYGSLL